ncbi:unnamed protein product [Vitrella brassicaformis CCMP3155]|uniref:D-xylose 1-dehydrogenase (NADP(+), D-xylono-1,5-lactone-forming) n=1 Tax=Vitrella brassicaformis (strain CCMP3155) TaxID=1169540 RepID=A0A0G4EV56_VITBC|nr:unnamed protein product [Vitrella brassicaformis CCMP3155]|mmetsp:Transcript_47990/g.120125  ORF Transcript_47990/g.120125 Transcript_47990/m.120125 type:complete len:369 (-) Transcript_47990:1423-2529(-)|eukprot:CEM02222.1 unnamed protein product [Vitrella brassicaformis CCMP3155]
MSAGDGSKVRWAVIGTGNICSDFCAALKLVDNAETVAVAARELPKAQAFAKRFGIGKAYGSYDELARDRSLAVDVCYVGLINTKHKDVVCELLRNGRNVVCEKPLGMTVEEVKEMVKVARDNKSFLTEGFWTRHFPAFKKIDEIVSEGTIGRVSAIHCDFGFLAAQDSRTRLKELGGGAIYDIGCYTVQYATHLLGTPAKSWRPLSIAAAGVMDPVEQVDLNGGISMTFDDKSDPSARLRTLAVLHFGTDGRRSQTARILGDKGHVEVHRIMHCPTHVTCVLYTDGGSVRDDHTFELPAWRPGEGGIPEDFRFFFANSEGLAYEAERVGQCVKEGLLEMPECPLDESIAIAQIMQTAREQMGGQQMGE